VGTTVPAWGGAWEARECGQVGGGGHLLTVGNAQVGGGWGPPPRGGRGHRGGVGPASGGGPVPPNSNHHAQLLPGLGGGGVGGVWWCVGVCVCVCVGNLVGRVVGGDPTLVVWWQSSQAHPPALLRGVGCGVCGWCAGVVVGTCVGVCQVCAWCAVWQVCSAQVQAVVRGRVWGGAGQQCVWVPVCSGAGVQCELVRQCGGGVGGRQQAVQSTGVRRVQCRCGCAGGVCSVRGSVVCSGKCVQVWWCVSNSPLVWWCVCVCGVCRQVQCVVVGRVVVSCGEPVVCGVCGGCVCV